MVEDLYAVAAAIFSKNNNKVLAILRPNDPHDFLANLWGLPAVSYLLTEAERSAAVRIGPEKLGTVLHPIERLGELKGQRALGILTLTLWRCTMLQEPDFSNRQLIEGKSVYQKWAWKEPHELIASAQLGSLCSGVLLNHLRISYD